jgi:hypothetical protein
MQTEISNAELVGKSPGEDIMKKKIWTKFAVIFAIVCAVFLLIAVISSLITCRYGYDDLSTAATELVEEEYGVSARVTDVKKLNGAAVAVCMSDTDAYVVQFSTGMFSGKYKNTGITKAGNSTEFTFSGPVTPDVEYTVSSSGTVELNAVASSGRYTWQIVIALLLAVYLAYFWSFGAERRRKQKEFLENSVKNKYNGIQQ